MKICVVSRGDLSLFPPTQGASVKLYYTIKSLSLLGAEVFFVTAENEHYFQVVNGTFKKKKYPAFLARSPLTKEMENYLSFLGTPPEVFVLYHPLINFKLWFKLLYVALKEKVDVIQAEFTCFGIPALFVKLLTSKPVCLVEHNVESFQIPEVTKISKIGRKTIERIEKFVCNFSDRIVAVSKEDKERLKSLGVSERKISVIPHGVDLDTFKKADGNLIRRKYKLKFPTLIFHGVYAYKPNYDAIKTIAEEILPKLEKKGIRTRVLAVGAFPPRNVNHPSIIFTGSVKDLPSYVDSADIAVVPIQAGGGMRMKILEYFAAGKPVVCTKKGVEGIPVKNGREVVLSEIEDFPEQIKKLVKSKKMRERLAENAIKFVQNYGWKNICKKYIELYNCLLSSIKVKKL